MTVPPKSWKHPREQQARNAVARALKSGDLVKPEACENCYQSVNVIIEGHHPSYMKPLTVEWLCRKCHRSADRRDHPKGCYRRTERGRIQQYRSVVAANRRFGQRWRRSREASARLKQSYARIENYRDGDWNLVRITPTVMGARQNITHWHKFDGQPYRIIQNGHIVREVLAAGAFTEKPA